MSGAGHRLFLTEKEALISYEVASRLWAYDRATGAITWLVRRGCKVRAGDVAGSACNGYRQINISLDGRQYCLAAHRLAWLLQTGTWPAGEIDHKNGEPTDNRWDNLRDVPHQHNIQNQRRAPASNQSTGLLGVSFDKARGKWLAGIRVNGRRKNIGRFSCPHLAHQAYLDAKRVLHAGGLL